jgi:hypothetical protein
MNKVQNNESGNIMMSLPKAFWEESSISDTLYEVQLETNLLEHKTVSITQLSECYITFHLFGPKRDEVTGQWRKLHCEELHNLYSSTNIKISQ